MTAVDETAPPLDDLFRDLLDVIADECGVKPARTWDRCRGGMGIRCQRTRSIGPDGYCLRCHRRWLRRDRADWTREYLELTRERHLSQRAAAARVGISRQTATRFEAGLRRAAAAATVSTVDWRPRPESAYDLIAPDADDVGWEWRRELHAEMGDKPAAVRVLWECQELTERRDQAAAPQAGDVAA